MKKPKRLAKSEWEIMNGVGNLGERVTVRDVHTRLYPGGQKAYTTVQTTMNILVEKGFLEKEKIGLVNFYTPTTSRDQAAHLATRTLVSRAFNGSFFALANHLVDSGSLSAEDLAALRKTIQDREAAGSDGGR